MIPVATCKKLIKETSPNYRVGNDASTILAETLEELGRDISDRAKKLAHHAGRKTIKAEDILMAVDELY